MRNLTLLTDLYQLTMLNGYFEKNIHEDMVIFDMFFRKNACNGGYTIVCGIEQFVEYINNIHFSEDDLAYLKSLNLFSDKFLTFLKDFKFTGDIYAVSNHLLQLKHLEYVLLPKEIQYLSLVFAVHKGLMQVHMELELLLLVVAQLLPMF